MDIATRAEIRTSAYKNKRGRIARSGGIANTAGANLQTEDEDRLGVKGEYFVDNVQTQAYVSPNPYSGIANATRIEFEVIEPYSVGQFLQTLQLAGIEAGYNNYLEAPFVLGVEFVGYDQNGITGTVEKRVMLLKLTKVTFNVTSAGSVYSVQAIPWNHQSLLDEVDRIPVNLQLKGDTVADILTSLAEGGIQTVNVVNQFGADPGTEDVSFVTGTRSLIKALTDYESDDIEAKGGSGDITPTQYEILFQDDPARPNTANNFANQRLVTDDFSAIPSQEIGLPEAVYDEENSLFTRGNLTIDTTSRVYQFKQGTKIEKIIEEVILTSEWAKDLVNLRPDEDGYIEWFKILTLCTIIDGDKDRFNSLPKKYTYIVHPYKIHLSALTSTSETINYNSSVQNAVKGYNYTYTGENTDIIDFNIDIDYAWIQAIPALSQTDSAITDRGAATSVSNPGAVTVGNTGEVNTRPDGTGGFRSTQGPTTSTFSVDGGTITDDAKSRVAKAFNDAIVNSNADLIKLKMTIWGDPYYLPDTDFGGYIAERKALNQSQDGAMDHIRSEVDVLIKFAGATDYVGGLLKPNIARSFSGVYRVIRVNSSFESNMFKQELEMIRRRNQDDATITNASNKIDAVSYLTDPALLPPTSGISGRQLTLFLRQAEETEKMFNIFGQLKLQEVATAFNATPFGLLSQLSGFTQLFDQVRQIKSAVGNLGNIAGNIKSAGINQSNLQELTAGLNNAENFFNKAFTTVDVSSITRVLETDSSNLLEPGQVQGKGLFPIPQTATIPPVAGGITSLFKPQPRPQNLNPIGTRLIETADGPRRVVTGASTLSPEQQALRDSATAYQSNPPKYLGQTQTFAQYIGLKK